MCTSIPYIYIYIYPHWFDHGWELLMVTAGARCFQFQLSIKNRWLIVVLRFCASPCIDTQRKCNLLHSPSIHCCLLLLIFFSCWHPTIINGSQLVCMLQLLFFSSISLTNQSFWNADKVEKTFFCGCLLSSWWWCWWWWTIDSQIKQKIALMDWNSASATSDASSVSMNSTILSISAEIAHIVNWCVNDGLYSCHIHNNKTQIRHINNALFRSYMLVMVLLLLWCASRKFFYSKFRGLDDNDTNKMYMTPHMFILWCVLYYVYSKIWF